MFSAVTCSISPLTTKRTHNSFSLTTQSRASACKSFIKNDVCLLTGRLSSVGVRISPFVQRSSKSQRGALVIRSAKGDPSLEGKLTPTGRPIVQQELRYRDLVKSIRKGEVKELVFAKQGTDRTIVVFKDGRVKLVHLASDDTVIADMMSLFGVKAKLATSEPPPPPNAFMRFTQDIASYWFPCLLMVGVYVGVTYQSRVKGDWDDRKKLRRLDAQKRREQRAMQKEQENEAAWQEQLAMEQGDYDDEEEEVDPLAESKKFLTTNARVNLTPKKAPDQEEKKRIFGFGKKKITLALQDKQEKIVKFADVAGIGEAKLELMEVVDFFLKPEKFRASGSRIPRGILLCGPPGTGKTLLARAVAGEAGVAFFSMTASEFVEMFVGVGAARVRDLFAQAKQAAPAIIFIDELDAVGRKRGGGGSGNDERDQTLNQLLSELDGFSDKSSIVVMAATNRPDVLDTALVRPGRFDRKVVIGSPDFLGRVEILKVHASTMPMEENVDLKELAFQTTGYTGAGLANIINMAALTAAKNERAKISQADLLNAVEVETLGKVVEVEHSVQFRKRLAVFEASRAIISELLPELEAVELVTIVPREKMPNGQLRVEDNEDRSLCRTYSRQYLTEQLIMTLGSRAAESMVYGLKEMSTINEESILIARSICSKMVMTAGMSDRKYTSLKDRVIAFPYKSGSYLNDATIQIVPGHITAVNQAHLSISEKMDAAYAESYRILSKNREAFDAVVDKLVECGSMTGDELREMMVDHGCKLPPNVNEKQKDVQKLTGTQFFQPEPF